MQTIYIAIDEDNRVKEWSSTFSEGYVEVVIEENHELLRNPFVFKYTNGYFIKDEVFQEEMVKNHLKDEQKENPIAKLMQQNAFLTMELASVKSLSESLGAQLSEVLLVLASLTKTPSTPDETPNVDESNVDSN